MAQTIADFVAEVVRGAGGSGRVWLDGFSASAGWYVGVATDGSVDDYRLAVEPTEEVLAEVAAGLTDGGLNVYRDQQEWGRVLARYDDTPFRDE